MLQFLLQLISTPITDPYIQKKWASPTAQVEWVIRAEAEGKMNVQKALDIAQCESSLGLNKVNPISSARGVYQFIDSTWEHYCDGDVMNDRDNVKCFVELYSKNPTWWECI